VINILSSTQVVQDWLRINVCLLLFGLAGTSQQLYSVDHLLGGVLVVKIVAVTLLQKVEALNLL
jgi:hypothetical protein